MAVCNLAADIAHHRHVVRGRHFSSCIKCAYVVIVTLLSATNRQHDSTMSASAVRSKRWRAKEPDEQRQSLRDAQTDRQRKRRADGSLLSVADRAYVGIARRTFTDGSVEPFCLGAMNLHCVHCDAAHFSCERVGGTLTSPHFASCCDSDKGRLTDILQPLPDIPDDLQQLLSDNNPHNCQFRSDIRAYNSVLAFTSVGVALNEDLGDRTGGVFTYRIRGELRHRIGSLAPPAGEPPDFAQFYTVDGDVGTTWAYTSMCMRMCTVLYASF